MNDEASGLSAAQTLYFAARRIATEALVPLTEDAEELERLHNLIGVDDLMWWQAQAISEKVTPEDAAWKLNPSVLVYITVGVAVEQRRHFYTVRGNTPRSGDWHTFARAAQACVDAIGGTPERLRGYPLDLSPPQASGSGVGGGDTGRVRNTSIVVDDDRQSRANGRLAGVLGAIVGSVLGLLLWPLLAAIASTGPASPYGAVGSPLGLLEEWWVWLVSVVGGGAAGWHIASG